MGFASRGSPSLSPRVSLLQVDEILLKGLPSPQRMGFASKDSPSQQRMGFASSGSPSPREWDSHQEGHPLQSEWDSHQEGHPLQSEWDSHQRVTLCKRMGFASRGSPSPKRMGFASNVGPSCSKRPLSRDPSPRPHYSRDSLFQRASPLRLSEWYSLQEILILPNNNVWVGGLRFSSTTHSFRASSREPSVKRPHPWSSPTHPYSPLWQDMEAEDASIPGPVMAMMDFGFFTEQGSGFPLSAHFYQEGIANTRSLRSYPEAYSFITWFVMAFIRSLHEKNFCLRTIQLSPSCRSPLPRVIRVWLLPHLRMLPSSPWRGDSLSTGSACSATHDLSLFKPHLKTSSLTTPSRRSLCLALGPEGLC